MRDRGRAISVGLSAGVLCAIVWMILMLPLLMAAFVARAAIG